MSFGIGEAFSIASFVVKLYGDCRAAAEKIDKACDLVERIRVYLKSIVKESLEKALGKAAVTDEL